MDLHQLCEEAMTEIRASHPEAVMKFDANGDIRSTWDADRFGQVVSNLLGNAVQHGNGTAITFTAEDQGDSVALAIQNGVPPIPPHVLPVLFEPLVRGSAESGSLRIGLGLFIARAIVSAHGGCIDVRSSANAGTTLLVELPKAMPAS